MIPAWLLIPDFIVGAAAGACAILAAAGLFLRTRPMDGRTYTGPLNDDEIASDSVEQLIRNINQQDR